MTFCASPNDNWSSLWQSGGGPSSDGTGYIYAETANGTFDVNTGGNDYGDSALKLDATGKVVDYFTPVQPGRPELRDIDFGSANPLVLPDQSGSGVHELRRVGQAGHLVSSSTATTWGTSRAEAATARSCSQSRRSPTRAVITGGIFMSPAYWNGHVYVAGIDDDLQTTR
jgi:hypothetical protein